MTEYPIHKQALYISTNIAFNCLSLFQSSPIAHILLLALHLLPLALYSQQNLQNIGRITRNLAGA